MNSSPRSTIRQHAERAAPEAATHILALGMVAHVGFAISGQPYVIPFSYHFDPAVPAKLYLHGGHSSRTLRHAADGAPICVTVTLLDGLVYSRSALYHSMNYRSVVAFGMARRVIRREEKARILRAMIGRYFPGRAEGRDYAPPTAAEMEATELLEMDIQEISAKARSGPAAGPLDGDPAAPGSCGVVEMDGRSW